MIDHERWQAILARLVSPIATAATAALLVLDATLGRRMLHAHEYPTAAGLFVLGAVAFRSYGGSGATIVASAVSISMSVLVSASDLRVWSRFIDEGAWPGLAETFGLALLAGWSTRWSRPSAAVAAVSAAACAFVTIATVRYDGPDAGVLAVFLLAGLATTVGIGVYLRMVEMSRAHELLRTRQDERLTLARELHDVVAHHVTGIVVQAQAARLVAESRPDAVGDALAAIEAAGSEAMSAMRQLVGTLRDDSRAAPVSPAAALADVRELAARSAAMGLPVRLHIEGVDDTLAAESATSVHRIVQEALTNARRHARGATVVDVWITQVDGELRVVVRDDGQPVRGRRRSGYGLRGMAERANALGGRFAAGPHPDGGWIVQVRLPYAAGGAA